MHQSSMEQILIQAFHPKMLTVIDESHLHAGHNDDAKRGGTHFKVTIVANTFEGKKLVDRHRMVYEALKNAAADYHALAITAKTEEEYQVHLKP